jgi:formylglycine-generating enzyme required for sulfatase activity
MGQNQSNILPETSGWDAEANEHPRIKWLYRILMGLGTLLGIAFGVGAYLYYTPVMLTVDSDDEITIEYGVQRFEYWRNEKQILSGYETRRTSNGIVFRRHWKKDLFHGLEESWYPSGQIRSRCCWVKGMKDGLDQYWHSNGQLSYEMTWDNGNPKAAPKQWDETGNEIPQPETLTIDIGDEIRLELVLIPAGDFMMEPDGSNYDIHKIIISKSFYMGKYEVTQEQYEKVMGTNPSHFKGANNPVEQVSWDDAQEFCMRLSQRTGYTISLPTEAQWEYACRAGSTTKWHFGDDESQLGDYAWYSLNSGGKTQPVGQKKPNAWGLYDMHGNGQECCQDGYDKYTSDTKTDSTGPFSGYPYEIINVGRGGGWGSGAGNCRSAKRFSISSHLRNNMIHGFRVIAVPKE